MLTLVADVLAYDIALETCDRRSSAVETEEAAPLAIWRRSLGLSLKDKSWTRDEKDIVVAAEGQFR